MSAPADYGDSAREVRAIREHAAVIDRNSIGRWKVTGRDRIEFLHRMSTQDIRGQLAPGRSTLAAFLTAKGRLVDVATLCDCGDWTLMLTSPGRPDELPRRLRAYVLADQVVFTDISAEGSAFRITGPRAGDVLASLGEVPPGIIAAIGENGVAGVLLSGIETTIVSEAAGPRPSWLLLAEKPAVAELFEAAAAVAKTFGGGPAGETARHAVRVDDGLPEAGSEIGEEFNPWEARLDRAISLTKGCYIGQEVVARLNTYDKVNKRLARLELADPGAGGDEAVSAWMPGAKLLRDGHDAGFVTSVAGPLVTGRPIGLGMVRNAHADPGTRLEVAGPGATAAPAATAVVRETA